MPGVDLILPDLSFIEKNRADLLGLIVTHAHEDHVGAIAALWPRLGCPVYATRFAAGLLATRRLAEPGAPKVPIHEVEQGGRLTLGPFEIEFVPMSHSIPESNLLAIRTQAGVVVHSGDWKLDPTPGLGKPTDAARLKKIGDEGVRALISDSTNILREGESPSEAQVAEVLRAKYPRRARAGAGHDFRLQCRALARGLPGGGSRGPARGSRRPRHGADARRGARMRLSRRCPGTAVAGQFFPPAAQTRWWRSPPAARARRGRPCRASCAATIR